MYQAGTLSGNPLAVAAGIAALKALKKPGTYHKLDEAGEKLAEGIRKASFETQVPLEINRVGSMFTVFFSSAPITDFQSAKNCDVSRYGKFFNALLDSGIYFAPSQFEACFISLAHNPKDIKSTIQAIRGALQAIASPS